MDLKIEDLSIGYGNKTILSDVNLVFKPKIIAVIGPNGAGKSTLIKAIAGINKVKKGTISFNERKIDKNYKEFYSKYLGYFPQFFFNQHFLRIFFDIYLSIMNNYNFIYIYK